jgi:DNA polymerase elongation subunit (family B)
MDEVNILDNDSTKPWRDVIAENYTLTDIGGLNNSINNRMLVSSLHVSDNFYYIFREGDFKIVEKIPDKYDYYISEGLNNYVEKKCDLKRRTISYSKRNMHQPGQNMFFYNHDININIIKNNEWRSNHPDEKIYPLRIAYIDIELYTNHDSIVNIGNIEECVTKFPINLITVYDSYKDIYHTWVLNLNNIDENLIDPIKINDYLENISNVGDSNYKLDIRVFDTERVLIEDFLHLIDVLDFDVYSGWNSTDFDWNYICKRCLYLGITPKNKYGVFFFTEKQRYRKGAKISVEEITIPCAAELDYMRLYQKYQQNEKESYKLDFIANLELKFGKVKLEDRMDDVFDNDICKFIAYNIIDVHLVRKIDEKLKFINLSHGIMRMSNVTWNEIWGTIQIIDGVLYKLTESRGECLIDIQTDKKVYDLEGAYVRPNAVGIFDFIADLDATALYPTCIARYNLSPDTYMASIDREEAYLYMYKKDEFFNKSNNIEIFNNYSKSEEKIKLIDRNKFDKWITNNKFILTMAGTIFMPHTMKLSILHEISYDLFKRRTDVRKLESKAQEDGDENLYSRYNIEQKSIKIIMNAIYGACNNKFFRLNHNEMGDTITASAREVSWLAATHANNYIKKILEAGTLEIDDNTVPLDIDFIEKAKGNLEYILYGDSVTGDSKIDMISDDTTSGWNIGIEEYFNELYLDTTNEIVYENNKHYIYPKNNCYARSYDNESGTEIFDKINYFVRHETNKKIYEINAGGRKVKVTEDHSIVVYDEKGNSMLMTPRDLLTMDKEKIKSYRINIVE